MNITAIGMDIGKRVFHLIAHDAKGHEVWRRALRRAEVLPFMAQVPACRVVIEACGGSNYWGRELERLGHEVVRLPTQHVRAYVRGNKHDYNDADALLEAAGRARHRSVALKGLEAQDVQSLHRVRQTYLKQRTSLVNQWRGLLAEYGVVLPAGITAFRREAPKILATEDPRFTAVLRELLTMQWEWLKSLEAQIATVERRLRQVERDDPRMGLLRGNLPGVGTLTATALVSRIGDGRDFRRGRDLSAWLGIVPRQHSTGGKTKLLGISKRGDPYLRTLFIHGARTVVQHATRKSDPFSAWVNRLRARRGMNIAVVAVANKNARMAWALLHKQAHGLSIRPVSAAADAPTE